MSRRRIGAAPAITVPASRRAAAAREAATRAREEGMSPSDVADAEARADAAEAEARGSGIAGLVIFGAVLYLLDEGF